MGDSRVRIIGYGRFAQLLAERVAKALPWAAFEGMDAPQAPPNAPPALVLAVTRLDEVDRLDLQSLPCGILYIGLWRSYIYVGPFWHADRQGCPHCLVARVANSPYGPDVGRDLQLVRATYGRQSEPPYAPAALAITATLAAREIDDAFADHAPRTLSGAFILDTRSNEVAFEALLPDATCAVCGDAPTTTLPTFTSRDRMLTKPAASLRAIGVRSMAEEIDQHYLHAHIGLTKGIQHDLQSPYGACSLELPLKWGKKEATIGRSESYRNSQTIALLEALERYAGWNRGGRREVIRATYASVADQALNPIELGVHPDECYQLADYPFTRFSPDLPIDWVWGYSFRSQRPILVPERSAFYGFRPGQETTFAYETSNGCALGSSPEEAVIHGLLELVERDSFLMTWYRQLTLPELSTEDVPDRGVRMLISKGELFTQSRLRIFLSTMEHGIPSVWVSACGDAPDGPCVVAGAGAHPDLMQALKSALYEVIGLVLRIRHSYQERRERALAMMADPMLVRQMEDHALVNCLPEARARFAFLLDQPTRSCSLVEASSSHWTGTDNMRRDMERLVDQVLQVGLDVIVVDQTMAELRASRLTCVRVIVPGLLPMTFGHMFRRVEHLPRLFSETIAARYPSNASSPDQIGALPHPFP